MSRRATTDAAASLAELVSRLAHEVRGPLSTLRGLVGTALTHYEGLSDEERREFLELMRDEAERLEATVEQVVLALRLDAGAVRIDRRPHDLADVVRSAAEAEDVSDHSLEVDAGAAVVAPVDPAHLSTVVRELVRNAATFSPPDAPIVVRVGRAGDRAVIEVLDRGPGIPPGRRDEAFERFTVWRPRGYEAASGPGLGLSIARSIVEEHGGSIAIEDAPGGGTMLAVRLPLEDPRGTPVDDAADL
jgi:signal transduction histidine kinase